MTKNFEELKNMVVCWAFDCDGVKVVEWRS